MRENIEEYRCRMWNEYLIEITDDYQHKGFILYGGSYKARIPEIRDDKPFVGRGYEPTYIIHAKYAQDLQTKINKWLRDHPEEKKILRSWRETV